MPTTPASGQHLLRRVCSRSVRLFSRGLCALFLALSLPGLLPAQTGGTVIGRIENAVSGSALNLARVTAKGTGREVFTNEYGEYQFSNLPAGEFAISDADLQAFGAHLA